MPKKQQNRRAARKGGARKLTDLPLAIKNTYDTMSCRLPNITQTCTLRCVRDFLVVASGTANQNPGYYFSLTNAAVGSAFFDRYRIEAIRFSVLPQNNAVAMAAPGTINLVDLYCVVDYDDSTSLTSVASAQSYASCIKLSPGQSCSRLFSPRIAVAAYNGAFTGFLNQGQQWIDSASPSVQHYGVKIFVPSTGVVGQTSLQTWDVTVEYYLAFKNTV